MSRIEIKAAPRLLTDDERLDQLRLIRSENVGPTTFHALTARFGSARAALEALPELARRGGARAIRIASRTEAERELARTQALSARIVAIGEDDYPALLAQVDAPPPLLTFRGSSGIPARAMVALVGSRNASAVGRRFTRDLAEALGAAGYVVISGLARGIDAAAHEASLATGTIAVLAGGIDRIYPAEHTDLLRSIEREGAALTEMPLGWQAQARDFPRRNRIISGCALGVVIVEAADRSGSLITARFALEQGREVFAVPGSPLDPRAAGTNRLIKDGASIVTSIADVIDALDGASVRVRPREEPILFRPAGSDLLHPAGGDLSAEAPAPGRARLLAALGPAPVEIDTLVREAELTPAVVAVILLELELAGRVERHPGNRVSFLG